MDAEGRTAREQILDASAALFVSQGLAATTTRQIAERVGVRQASLYYYFGGKDEILLELLTQSVRPSLSVARRLESSCGDDPAAGLYALAVTDVRTLALAPHNIAMLYLSPEVQGPAFDDFRAERAALQEVYGRLGAAAAVPATGAVPVAAGGDPGATATDSAAPDAGLDESLTGTLIMQLVESVIQLRRAEDALRDGYPRAIAESCLRLAGLPAVEVNRARAAAEKLLAEAGTVTRAG